ncbi:MAG TPA: hypothetical protein VK826_04385 [Bacteroidia bacterium]|nr:hypothetical protein [Bacteroidia bacterium]
MKRIFVVVVMTLIFVQINAQEQKTDSMARAKNTVFVELLGRGVLYSVNYERWLFSYRSLDFSGQVGLSVMKNQDLITFPLALNVMKGKVHHPMISIGYTQVLWQQPTNFFKNDYPESIFIVGAGYKYQRPEGGFYFTLQVMKFFPVDENILIWGGLGIGYTFKQQTA